MPNAQAPHPQHERRPRNSLPPRAPYEILEPRSYPPTGDDQYVLQTFDKAFQRVSQLHIQLDTIRTDYLALEASLRERMDSYTKVRDWGVDLEKENNVLRQRVGEGKDGVVRRGDVRIVQSRLVETKAGFQMRNGAGGGRMQKVKETSKQSVHTIKEWFGGCKRTGKERKVADYFARY